MTRAASAVSPDEVSARAESDTSPIRLLAFYLPQYHPIPENDEWWGKGFTEWRNVVQAKALFKGHHQPHLPAELGFYDLRVPETRESQADLARSYGVSGFCYYHYWFNGRRLLHRPLDDLLDSGRPRFPFCLCWANENWTRRWDGREQDVLLRQTHTPEDDRAHISHLVRAFADERYVKIDGRPVFLVYRADLLPEPARTADIWRAGCRQAGLPDLYLVRVEGHGPRMHPARIGFDAAVEFAPDWGRLPAPMFRRDGWDIWARVYNQLRKAGLLSSAYATHSVYSYEALVEKMQPAPPADYTRFRCATPGWDNSPRRKEGALIFQGSTPELYQIWLEALARETRVRRHGEERLLFVNAWNEWAEGNHLEPDRRWGRAYLEATRRALHAGAVVESNGRVSVPSAHAGALERAS
jgi:lipopolysaccharide biosynthesis protein